jgi:hypothetical protein
MRIPTFGARRQGAFDGVDVQHVFADDLAIDLHDRDPGAELLPPAGARVDVQNLDPGAAAEERQELSDQLFAQMAAGAAVDLHDALRHDCN